MFLILYVDDILLIGNNVSMLNLVKESLNGKFLMKVLGEAVYILGIKIYRDRSRRPICLQRIYNFLLSHAFILSILDVLYAFIWFLGLTY